MRDGPRRFPQGSTCPVVLRIRAKESARLSCTGLSPSMADLSRVVPLTDGFVTPRDSCKSLKPCPTTPPEKRLQSYNRGVWAVPRSLAATEGVAVAFLSSGYLDVSVPLVDLAEAMTGHDPSRVSPFGNPGFKACLTAPPGLSQPSTSFVVSRCPGIHHVHFVA